MFKGLLFSGHGV